MGWTPGSEQGALVSGLASPPTSCTSLMTGFSLSWTQSSSKISTAEDLPSALKLCCETNVLENRKAPCEFHLRDATFRQSRWSYGECPLPTPVTCFSPWIQATAVPWPQEDCQGPHSRVLHPERCCSKDSRFPMDQTSLPSCPPS